MRTFTIFALLAVLSASAYAIADEVTLAQDMEDLQRGLDEEIQNFLFGTIQIHTQIIQLPPKIIQLPPQIIPLPPQIYQIHNAEVEDLKIGNVTKNLTKPVKAAIVPSKNVGREVDEFLAFFDDY